MIKIIEESGATIVLSGDAEIARIEFTNGCNEVHYHDLEPVYPFSPKNTKPYSTTDGFKPGRRSLLPNRLILKGQNGFVVIGIGGYETLEIDAAARTIRFNGTFSPPVIFGDFRRIFENDKGVFLHPDFVFALRDSISNKTEYAEIASALGYKFKIIVDYDKPVRIFEKNIKQFKDKLDILGFDLCVSSSLPAAAGMEGALTYRDGEPVTDKNGVYYTDPVDSSHSAGAIESFFGVNHNLFKYIFIDYLPPERIGDQSRIVFRDGENIRGYGDSLDRIYEVINSLKIDGVYACHKSSSSHPVIYPASGSVGRIIYMINMILSQSGAGVIVDTVNMVSVSARHLILLLKAGRFIIGKELLAAVFSSVPLKKVFYDVLDDLYKLRIYNAYVTSAGSGPAAEPDGEGETGFLVGTDVAVRFVTDRLIYSYLTVPAGEWYSVDYKKIYRSGKYLNSAEDKKKYRVFTKAGSIVPILQRDDDYRIAGEIMRMVIFPHNSTFMETEFCFGTGSDGAVINVEYRREVGKSFIDITASGKVPYNKFMIDYVTDSKHIQTVSINGREEAPVKVNGADCYEITCIFRPEGLKITIV